MNVAITRTPNAGQRSFPRWGQGIIGEVGDITIELRDRSSVVARSYVVRRTVSIGEDLLAVGFGGIWTDSARRRQGLNRELNRLSIELAKYSWGARIGMLFCLDRLLGHYERQGWTRVDVPVTMGQPGGPIPVPNHVNTMIWLMSEVQIPQKIEIRGLPW